MTMNHLINWIMTLHCNSLILAVPIILVVIPLTVDLATGFTVENDIIIKRANSTEELS